jgi:hypothetical protein
MGKKALLVLLSLEILLISSIWFDYFYEEDIEPQDLSDPMKENIINCNISKNKALSIALNQIPEKKIYAYMVNQVFIDKTIQGINYVQYVWYVRIYVDPLDSKTVNHYSVYLDLNTGEIIKIDKVTTVAQSVR